MQSRDHCKSLQAFVFTWVRNLFQHSRPVISLTLLSFGLQKKHVFELELVGSIC